MKTCLKAVSALAFGLGLGATPVLAGNTDNSLPPIQQGIGERGSFSTQAQERANDNLTSAEQDRIRADANMRRRDTYMSRHSDDTVETGQNHVAETPPSSQVDTHVNGQAHTNVEVEGSRNKSVHNAAMRPSARARSNAEIGSDAKSGNTNNTADVPHHDPVVPHVTPHAVGR